MEHSINERINTLARNFFGENNSKFAEMIGTSEANIRNYRKKTAPGIDILEKICDNLEISCEWLLFGKGNMFTNSNPKLLSMDIKHAPVYPDMHRADVKSISNISVREDVIGNNAPMHEVLFSTFQAQVDTLQAQIKEKDEQIKKLLSIIERLSNK